MRVKNARSWCPSGVQACADAASCAAPGSPGGADGVDDGKIDASFHSPAYLAAHIASLQARAARPLFDVRFGAGLTRRARAQATERITYDDFKKKQQARPACAGVAP